MRRGITRTLFAATAASATVILAAAAATAADAATVAAVARISPLTGPPSGGRPIYTTANCYGFGGGPLRRETSDQPATPPPCAQSGYQASGRDFRFVQALIAVPKHTAGPAVDPMVYVALDASTQDTSDYARAGIEPDVTSPTGWDTFLDVQQPSLAAPVFITRAISTQLRRGGIFVSIYLSAAGNSLHFVTALPGGRTFKDTVAVNGPVYTAAQALTDWSDTDASPALAVPAASTRLAQFLRGRFTTLSGAQGTFEGPWALNPVAATSNGFAPPNGILIAGRSYLWADGKSLGGRPGDAFGVWLYSRASLARTRRHAGRGPQRRHEDGGRAGQVQVQR